jgi:starvation-inducible DNA-binding protein
MKYYNLVEQAEQMVSEQTEPALIDALYNVTSDAFVFYFKAHSFHWNVTGKDFPQLHDFFGKIYENVFDKIDHLAEHLRALNAAAPMNLASIIASSKIMENKDPLTAMEMVAALEADNNKVLAGLLACAKMAEAADEIGLNDFLTQLYDEHKKLAWMLSSTLKGL